jgi:hypothetical protein
VIEEISSRSQTSQKIEGLYPNSDYDVTVLFYSDNGHTTKVKLNVKTSVDPNDEIKSPMSKRIGKLTGTEW